MIEVHSLFDGFAANSVRCLNEVSSQGELADKRSVKKASMEFVFRTIICGSVSIYMSITLRQTFSQINYLLFVVLLAVVDVVVVVVVVAVVDAVVALYLNLTSFHRS